MGGKVELRGGKHQSRFVMKVHVEGTAWLPPADPSLHRKFTYLRKCGIKRVSCINPTSKVLSAILLVLPPYVYRISFLESGFIWRSLLSGEAHFQWPIFSYTPKAQEWRGFRDAADIFQSVRAMKCNAVRLFIYFSNNYNHWDEKRRTYLTYNYFKTLVLPSDITEAFNNIGKTYLHLHAVRLIAWRSCCPL